MNAGNSRNAASEAVKDQPFETGVRGRRNAGTPDADTERPDACARPRGVDCNIHHCKSPITAKALPGPNCTMTNAAVLLKGTNANV